MNTGRRAIQPARCPALEGVRNWLHGAQRRLRILHLGLDRGIDGSESERGGIRPIENVDIIMTQLRIDTLSRDACGLD
jgi:hypothetical protein